jgi:oxygen-independent coproporphyrinogen-3 oxidase
MAGIYLHIPFCRQACHYCDFHFSTYHPLFRAVIKALSAELRIRKDYLGDAPVETIYFGGGTPSLADSGDLGRLLDIIYKLYPVQNSCETTLEANPDDLSEEKLKELKSLGINRLSIGAQSFNDEILTYLNRVHRAHDTRRAFLNARESGFGNINLDLIYAIRPDHMDILKEDVREILELRPEHISAYCLTIEPRTVFGKWVEKKRIPLVPDDQSAEQYDYLSMEFSSRDYDHYEISNFGLHGYLSRHNMNYWKDQIYLGVGPSAHSYNQVNRQYNVSNNSHYIQSLESGKIPATIDYLSVPDRINERILTGLRTIWGCDLEGIQNDFGIDILEANRDSIQKLIKNEMIILDNGILKLNKKGRLFADKIASDLFVIE